LQDAYGRLAESKLNCDRAIQLFNQMSAPRQIEKANQELKFLTQRRKSAEAD
jgi:hypothetical protein